MYEQGPIEWRCGACLAATTKAQRATGDWSAKGHCDHHRAVFADDRNALVILGMLHAIEWGCFDIELVPGSNPARDYFGHHHYRVTGGWELLVCQKRGEWHYLEAAKVPGIRWVEPYSAPWPAGFDSDDDSVRWAALDGDPWRAVQRYEPPDNVAAERYGFTNLTQDRGQQAETLGMLHAVDVLRMHGGTALLRAFLSWVAAGKPGK